MSVRRSLFLSFAQRYTGLVLQFAATLILSRLLTPHEIGVFSVSAAIVALAHALRDFGVSDYLIQEPHLTKERIRSAFSLTLGIAWILAGGLWMASGILAEFFHEPLLRSVLPILAANFLFLPLGSPAFALLSREMEFGKIYIIQTLAGIAQATVSVTLAVWHFGPMSLAWGSLCGTVVTVIVAALYRPRDTLLLPGFAEWRHVGRFSIFSSGSSMMNELTRSAHEFILGKILGFESVGLYSRAAGLIETFHGSITSAITRVLLPAYAAGDREARSMKHKYSTSITLFSAIAWPFFAVLFVLAKPVIHILFGDQWAGAAPAMHVLALNAMIYCLWAFAPQALTASGGIRQRFRIQAVALPIQIGLMMAASTFGLVWVAVAATTTGIVILGMYMRALKQTIGFCWPDLRRAIQPTLAPTMWSVLVPAAVLLGQPTLGYGSAFQVVVGGAGAAIAWMSAMVMTEHPLKPEIERAWTAIRSRIAGMRI